MKLGKVIGRVVCTQKLEVLDGLKLLLVQPIDEQQHKTGDPIVAFDAAQAGEGDLIFYETSKEAGWALREWFTPADAAILGVIDHLDTIGEAAQ
ncbi:ethanolamine utilization protein EutN [candidate division KSB3 bacterium]|uniref:Ethanolamine utilization protein EutN n=1 Tax=candidate division KSB3 bacterium TaxID=2044937 RepID=A0A2G6KFN2_9BACT|nr:MAG: ethanolamine utilization protein EutN [candidate division KSB3 bacterium]